MKNKFIDSMYAHFLVARLQLYNLKHPKNRMTIDQFMRRTTITNKALVDAFEEIK